MKITKRILTIILSIALVFGGLYFAAPKITKAADDFAITSPTNDSLQPAGPIDITWEDAGAIRWLDSYDVFIDGELVANTTEQKYEFYTTAVYYHTVWIRANFKDGTNHYTTTVRFGVSKKGLGTEDGMARKMIDPQAMGISWYYNWGRGKYTDAKYKNLDYVPMVWGDKDAGVIRNKLQAAVNSGSKNILGYNEPDMGYDVGGCNMKDVSEVISLWNQHFTPFKEQIRLGSPAYATWGSGSQMVQFMSGVKNEKDDNVAFVCLHCYPWNFPGGKSMSDWMIKDVIKDAHDRYGKPIWLTEYSTTGDNTSITPENTASFIENFFQAVDELDYVERHAWFSFDASSKNGGLYYYSNGALTKAGEAFAKYGNPEKDFVAGNERNPRDGGGPATTKPTVKPTTKATVKPTQAPKKPAKAKISKAKNNKKKKISLKFKKVAGAKVYEIMYSEVKNFDGYWTKNTTKTKFTLKKLDKNTKYYIKIRAYKLFNGAKLYGPWSKVKKVKVRK